MNKDELLLILRGKLAKYRLMPYAELSQRVGNQQPETDSQGDPNGQNFYQTEVEVVRDDAHSGNLRVIGMIDNGKGLSGTYDLIISPDGTLLAEGGNVRGCSAGVVKTALSLFLLRALPFERFAFPRWQALAGISLIGLLVGLDPALRAGTPEMPGMPGMPGMPLALALVSMLLSVWVAFLIIHAVLRWWLRRGARWDGQGDLFNLMAASWLVSNVLGAVLVAVGVPYLLTLPLWLYAVWVGANALSGAIPKASLGYCIGGIALSLLPAMLATGLIGAAIFLLFAPGAMAQ
ncbi:MAG: hypothetical protein M1359_02665 [Betaproteobacteria bacterium]|nr:hypothetical protein [Serpentinimonas maccroryi]MCL5968176.1 hypothetical protein [Betaproteobacteria bacterium]